MGVSAWGGWDSWGGSGWRRVQICHKDALGRDRRRTEARNINDSLPAFRLDRGLCGRFGQPAPSGQPGGAVTGRAAGLAPAWTTSHGPVDSSGPVGAPVREGHRHTRTGPGAQTGPGGLAHPRTPPGRPRSFASA